MILVTGGAGYIGSHTCKILSSCGHESVVIDNLSTGHKSAVKWSPLVIGDIADETLVKSIINQYQIDAVIHFAANAYVSESIWNPRKYYENNVLASINLLHAIVDSGVKHFVFSSSCATYGIPQEIPITESQLCQPINPYDESKLVIEKALKWYGEAYGFNWIALRYFNASGAEPSNEIGENHIPETHLIPLAIFTALGKQPFFNIYGNTYPTKDGTAIRDYIHVLDLAMAHVLAVDYLLQGNESKILNLGIGEGYSVYDVIKATEEVSNRTIKTKIVNRREGDPPVLIASPDQAKECLNWSPQFNNLQSCKV